MLLGHRSGALCAAVILWTMLPSLVTGQERQTARSQDIRPASGPISIDGVVEEAAWVDALTFTLDWQTFPTDNTVPPHKTTVHLTHDDDNFYAAFIAEDPEPDKIRAHLSDRDSAFNDDFLGIELDTFNSGRRAFEFFVNPLGVQMDLIQDDISGGEDASWDAIWDSAARITATGWEAEFSIPFSQLRFQKTSGPQTWGLEALRIRPREQRDRYGLNRLARDVSCHLCQIGTITGFENVSPGRGVELVPTMTARRTDARDELDGPLVSGDENLDFGLTASWSVTPNWTVLGTVQPDFSQIEADAVQLDINAQFALFFGEKRPFFLEGSDFFDTPLNFVHTRSVADPDYGLKLTGKEGKNALGAFLARDSLTNLIFPGSQRSNGTSLSEDVDDAVFRWRHDVGESGAIGVLYTGRHGQDYDNQLVAIDGLFRFGQSDRLSFQLAGSRTDYPEAIVAGFDQPDGSFSDRAFRLSFSHSDEDWAWSGRIDSVGPNFRSDLGFVPQANYWKAIAGATRKWWGKEGETWWSQIRLGFDVDQTEEQEGSLIEREQEFFFNLDGPMQSDIDFGGGRRDRNFGGQHFDQEFFWTWLSARPSAKWNVWAFARVGDEIDFAHVRAAEATYLETGLGFRPGRHLNISLDSRLRWFDVDPGELFQTNVTSLRAVWQFNVRSFIRLITQYVQIDRDPTLYDFSVDSSTETLFNQVLFSYKVNPQTVVFLGYADNHFSDDLHSLTQTDQTVFLKLGYAWLR